MTTLIRVDSLAVEYYTKEKAVRAVDNVNLKIPYEGYNIGLVGESGSGKTTLGMSIINLIERPGKIVAGKIEYQGMDVLSMTPEQLRKYRWKEVSIIYQSAMNSLNPVKTISSHIAEVITEHTSQTLKEAKEKAIELLASVGIRPEHANDYPHELSGGMKQRVVIAMALALSPKLLIADEPTSALDVVTQKEILSLIWKYVYKQNLSLIFITHELSILPSLVENVAVMYQGEIVELGPLKNVLSDPLHPYTEALLNSLLTFESKKTKLSAIPEPLSNTPVTIGCKYASICKYAFDRCRVERPKLVEHQPGRKVACHKYS